MDFNFKHYKNSLGRTYCILRYFSADEILLVSWRGTAPEDAIQEVRDGIRELLEKNSCQRILNDVQHFFSASAERLYVLTETDWNKEAKQLGVRYIAHVLKPEKDLPRHTNQQQADPQVRFFNERLDAYQWLRQQPIFDA